MNFSNCIEKMELYSEQLCKYDSDLVYIYDKRKAQTASAENRMNSCLAQLEKTQKYEQERLEHESGLFTKGEKEKELQVLAYAGKQKFMKECSETVENANAEFRKNAIENRAAYNKALNELKGCVNVPEKIYLGKAEYGKAGESFSVYCSRIDKNIFIRGTFRDVHGFICSQAVKLAEMYDDCEIYIADHSGLGSNYMSLSGLEKCGRVQILDSEEDTERALSYLENCISAVCRNNLGPSYLNSLEYNSQNGEKIPYRFFFSADLAQNITGRTFQSLVRVMENGNKAGVYSLIAADNLNRFEREKDALDKIIASSVNLSVSENRFFFKGRLKLCPSLSPDINTAKRICSVSAQREAFTTLPLDPYLDNAQFHRRSSKDGLSFFVGEDVRKQLYQLNFSKDKPYAIIAGDVASGKSSLLHSIILQSMFYYSPGELIIAAADFKNGAEFNIYAKRGITDFRAVINNEDPDVMESFISHFNDECRSRQEKFDSLYAYKLEEIRNYEEYRETERKYGIPNNMPRILIVIDEFLSLFNNTAATARKMTELVKKARTYGIFIIMASQRLSSDDTRNSFSDELKSFFKYRIAFNCPQQAARKVINDTGVDGYGRQNRYLPLISTLECGQAVINNNSGQSESGTSVVKCFYPSNDLITRVCEKYRNCVGVSDNIPLLKENMEAIKPRVCGPDAAELGKSCLLKLGPSSQKADAICDDMDVYICGEDMENILSCSGNPDVHASLLASLSNFSIANGVVMVAIGEEDSLVRKKLSNFDYNRKGIFFLESVDELSYIYESYINGEFRNYIGKQFIVAILEPEKFAELRDTGSGLRMSEQLSLVKKAMNTRGMSFLFCTSNFRNLRNGYSYIADSAPIRIIGVGNTENKRNAAPEMNFAESQFDIPCPNSIKAYYYNLNTGNQGKMVMYSYKGGN